MGKKQNELLLGERRLRPPAHTRSNTQNACRDGVDRVEFSETQRISTYLVAFSIGDFAVANTTTKDSETVVGAAAIREMSNDVSGWAKIAAGCVEGMEKLVNISYPFGKLQNVIMRSMGESGAMENAGHIVYADIVMHVPEFSNLVDLTLAHTIFCHEACGAELRPTLKSTDQL